MKSFALSFRDDSGREVPFERIEGDLVERFGGVPQDWDLVQFALMTGSPLEDIEKGITNGGPILALLREKGYTPVVGGATQREVQKVLDAYHGR